MNTILFSQIWELGMNVWREAVRDKAVQIIVASGIMLMFFSLVLGRMAVGGEERVLQSTGFWILGIWGLVSVIYMGSNIVRREIQSKTVYMVLSRPVNRTVFMFGKFFGMLMVLFSAFCILGICWLILLKLKMIPVSSTHFWALLFIFGEWVMLAAFSLFFASFTTPLLHNFFLAGISFLGHWLGDLRMFAENSRELWLKYILRTIYHILPNLEALNFRADALYSRVPEPGLLAEGCLVLSGWTLAALIAANIIFARRRLL
ncbi:MAG: ABC transporter permease [Desulfobacterales bacterium]